jgi:hypothetical protein
VLEKYKYPSLFTGLLIFQKAVMEATFVCLIFILFLNINILDGETLALKVLLMLLFEEKKCMLLIAF